MWGSRCRSSVERGMRSVTLRLILCAGFKDETNGNAEVQSFWTEFLGMFGIDRKRVNAIFEDRAHRSDTGGRGRIDMCWPGQSIGIPRVQSRSRSLLRHDRPRGYDRSGHAGSLSTDVHRESASWYLV